MLKGHSCPKNKYTKKDRYCLILECEFQYTHNPFGKSRIKSETPLFGQILNLMPNHLLTTVIGNNLSDKHCSKHKTKDQLVSMMFGQLNKCLSLRELRIKIPQILNKGQCNLDAKIKIFQSHLHREQHKNSLFINKVQN